MLAATDEPAWNLGLSERIQQWLVEERTIFACFNNDAFGHAVEDARLLQELMTA